MNKLQALFATLLLFGAQQAIAGDTPTRTVLLVGDSLSSAHRIPAETGWVTLLEKRLASETPAPPTVINASRGGKTLTDALAELPDLLSKNHPDIVILELGGNDAILGGKSEEIRANLIKLIDLAQASGARVTLLGFAVPPMFDKDGAALALREAYVQAAESEHVSLLPSLLAGISDQPTLLLDDGVHPNAEAQIKVLDNAWEFLRPQLLK